ncbi:MAG: asparagine synthase (glutamine-hydrolyzing) [Actinomycetota bacterium]|nr:asparagine synthase (glutamine-hydrolyzing) [Actinomycetota bacterium]
MCGIAALLDPAGASHADAGRRMAEALRHRGPDGEAVERLGPATLVCTRLAIIDVAGGDQPLRSEDGEVALVANGEIYNHRELREELQPTGHRFATGSDCEALVHAYEEHGLDFVHRLNGMYGLALWDARQDRLVAARDPFGVKPVYWWSDGRRTAVASEVGALIAAGLVTPELDPIALDHYLACRFVPGPRTLFKGVSKLAPGDVLTAQPGIETQVTSFREAPGTQLDGPSEAELTDELVIRFADAVDRQMMSDVPYGAFLSGGVDSAAIVAAMARSHASPTTFTVGFPGAGDVLDEREAAAHSARILGSDHHDTAMVQGDYLTELGQAVRRLEEPCGIPSAPALLQLSRFAAREVKVVLSGQGADEPHGGYGRHQAAALLGPLSRLPGPLAKLAAAMPNERARRLGHLLGPMEDAKRLVRLVEISDSGLRHRLTGRSGEAAESERTGQAADLLDDVADRDLLGQALYLDTRMFLPSSLLICGDKMSMAAGLEQRVPFLDVNLMRFVERVPARARVRVHGGKRLHRRAMELMLPREIAQRPKHGFASPWDDWLKESLGQEIERRYAPGGELSELIDPAAATQMVEAHRSGRADHRWVLFCLLELSEWHEAFVTS